MTVLDHHKRNVERGPLFEGRDALPSTAPERHDVRLIAYYLPQFHRIAENDEWWGTGFTEWSNVTKALPRYVGHYQPRLPADLGFYDLANIDTIRRQADLAKIGGVYGFCIHDYWFAGRKLLETPLKIILDNPDIDLRFCVNWANENWTRTWDGLDRHVLMAQQHSPEDDVRYAESLLRCFADKRYIRVNGRPLMMVYRPGILPNASETVARWRAFFQTHGEADPFIVMAQTFGEIDPAKFGMDAAAGFPPHNIEARLPGYSDQVRRLDRGFGGDIRLYREYAEMEMRSRPPGIKLFPGVSPSWDNEARKPNRGFSLYGSTPSLYGAWLRDAARYSVAHAQTPDDAIVFINAWNEWAEGTYLEPDRHYGYAYLAETRRALDAINDNRHDAPAHEAAGLHTPHLSRTRGQVRRLARRLRRMIRPK